MLNPCCSPYWKLPSSPRLKIASYEVMELIFRFSPLPRALRLLNDMMPANPKERWLCVWKLVPELP